MTTLYTAHAAPVEAPAAAAPATVAKNIALFLVAPFVALAYVIAFPFVGLGALAWFAAKAAARRPAMRAVGRIAKAAGLVLAAPVITLGYVVLFPFAGLAALAWIGGKALLTRTETGKAEAEALHPVMAAA